jgi:hypothetical protein
MYRQDELDSMVGCTAFSSNLFISSSKGEIENLDGLRDLTYVNGGLRIFRFPGDVNGISVASLDALSNITFHPNKAMVVIDGLAQLESLDGLEKVVQASTIEITNNAKLWDLRGLRNVAGTVGTVKVMYNERLLALQPLEGVTGSDTETVNACLNNEHQITNCKVEVQANCSTRLTTWAAVGSEGLLSMPVQEPPASYRCCNPPSHWGGFQWATNLLDLGGHVCPLPTQGEKAPSAVSADSVLDQYSARLLL